MTGGLRFMTRTMNSWMLLIILVVGSFGINAQEEPDTKNTAPEKTTVSTSPDDDKNDVAQESSDQSTSVPEQAKQDADSKADKPSKEDDFASVLDALKAQLDAQNEQIEKLQARYVDELSSREQEVAQQNQLIEKQAGEIETQRNAMQSLQQQLDQMAAADERQLTEEEKLLRSRLQTVEESIAASQEADSTTYDLDKFPGSVAIPGTSAAMRIGGFVKLNVVKNFDPLDSKDRFIVSSIPVDGSGQSGEASLSANRSRINLELRDVAATGPLRIFVEGDFEGSSDTFRLRHAFGQYNSLLIGKTWSTFMDPATRPEDLDIEGTNGRILVRQPQIRYFPKIAEHWNLLASIEDTDPEISNGVGQSKFPDLVLSVERELDRWHLKSAIMYRSLEGTCKCLGGKDDKVQGWAVTLSGSTRVDWWDERDNVMFQVSYGSGYGRYVNDIGELGDGDAAFDPATGKLHALDVTAAYVAMQKWWTPSIRSNFNIGWVDLDNLSFQDDDTYQKSMRLSGNLIWSPTARVDLGVEYLTGRRWNKDDRSNNARQFQMSATYRY